MKDRLEQLKAVSPSVPGDLAGWGWQGIVEWWSYVGEGFRFAHHTQARGAASEACPPLAPTVSLIGSSRFPPPQCHVFCDSFPSSDFPGRL